ncbi:MAG: methylmalonyl-CoA epimerase [Candidatus Krumholzibacteriota bacterium]|nr:methylmalonyl-CoA epimerase [Candidatus Krumholzibacteriota bacterium]
MERLKELDHIGIAVDDLDEAKKLYCDILGFELTDERELPEKGLKIAFLSTGNTKIELLEGTSEESAITKFVAKKGAGIHHLCFEVDDITRTLEELSSEGIGLIDRVPRIGAEGHPIAFLHPGSTKKVLIELEEK